MSLVVLVSGGAGYIGSHVTLALLEVGYQPVVVDNLSTGSRELVPPGVPFVLADVGDQGRMGNVFMEHGVRAVVHLAGSIVVPDSVADPLGYYANNSMVSRNLIEVAVRSGVHGFIFSSTAAVYGDPGHGLLSEGAPTRPINPYGRSKLMTEWMLADTSAATGLPYVALRYFNVAGADPKGRAGQSTPRATHLIRVACQVAVGKRKGMTVFGTDYDTEDGTCVRDYIHVSDLATAHVLALNHLLDGGTSTVVNCGYGRGVSVHEVLSTVERVAGIRLDVTTGGRRPGDPGRLVAEASRIRQVLGWTPRHADLADIVTSALAWEGRGILPSQVARNR